MKVCDKDGYLITSINIDGSYHAICEDCISKKLRLVDLERGLILQQEYESIHDLIKVLELNGAMVRRERFV